MPKLAVLFLAAAIGLLAQEATSSGSQAPLEARYEILQNTPCGTLRLDRFRWNVYRFRDKGANSTPDVVWEGIEVEDLAPVPGDVPRFQISYTSNFSNSCLLLDTATGFTWRLITRNRLLVWVRVPEPR